MLFSVCFLQEISKLNIIYMYNKSLVLKFTVKNNHYLPPNLCRITVLYNVGLQVLNITELFSIRYLTFE